MQVLKFGTTIHTVFSAIFGLLDACCMKCALSSLHSKEKIWMPCMRKFSAASIKKYQKDIHPN
jgi:hypothetical protein